MERAEPAATISAGSADDLPPGHSTVVSGTDPPIAVFNVDGDYFATDDTCTHAKSSLAEDGYLEGDTVECAYHLARFCVRDGRVLAPPASVPLRTYAVTVVDGEILVHERQQDASGMVKQ